MSIPVRVVSLLSLVAIGAVTFFIVAGPSGGQTTGACLEKNQLEAKLRSADGDAAGLVKFGVDSTCKTKVSAKLKGLSQGFHGFHVHTTGTCDPAATDPNGNPSPFYSAGGHFNPSSTDHGTHAGDLAPQIGMDTGAAQSLFLTDKFQVRDLLDDDGSAVIVHAGADNLANIPATTTTGTERYHSHAYDTMGADQDSKATGDAGARFACGVVKKIKKG